MSPLELLGLLAVGTAAGLDLASGPQVLLARPLVAATLAGLCVGDAAAGLVVGSALELFALEVLPVGAARYPDHGPGAVGAALAVSLGGAHQLWFGVALGLVLAIVGSGSLRWLRRANARAVAGNSAALQALVPGILGRLHWSAFRRDLVRSAALTAVAIAAGWAAGLLPPVPAGWSPWLNATAMGAGAAAALNGALRNAGHGQRVAALGTGLLAGVLLVVLA
jgi:mannose/fructose/N-acetylgalactosamine-specific phosphotransferase system component IIC